MLNVMIRVAINGYGRIGRVAHRVILQKFGHEIEVVGINAGASSDLEGWMYLLKYDSVYRELSNHFEVKSPEEMPHGLETKAGFLGTLIIDDQKIPIFSEKDSKLYPWRELNVDVVIESTGVFTTEEKMQLHLDAGARAAILSAPFKGESGPTKVLGVNVTEENSGEFTPIVSNASCTTNCITPVAQVIQATFGVEKAMMSTIHGYTSDQRLQDGGHDDYRRARAAALNIIPTSTGAAKAAHLVVPELKGIFEGVSFRVPVPVGSLSDFTFVLKRDVTIDEVNGALEEASKNPRYHGILAVTRDPVVSSDIIGKSFSSLVDLSLTQVVGGNLVKVVAWYDNEFGYASRLVEQTVQIGRNIQGR